MVVGDQARAPSPRPPRRSPAAAPGSASSCRRRAARRRACAGSRRRRPAVGRRLRWGAGIRDRTRRQGRAERRSGPGASRARQQRPTTYQLLQVLCHITVQLKLLQRLGAILRTRREDGQHWRQAAAPAAAAAAAAGELRPPHSYRLPAAPPLRTLSTYSMASAADCSWLCSIAGFQLVGSGAMQAGVEQQQQCMHEGCGVRATRQAALMSARPMCALRLPPHMAPRSSPCKPAASSLRHDRTLPQLLRAPHRAGLKAVASLVAISLATSTTYSHAAHRIGAFDASGVCIG